MFYCRAAPDKVEREADGRHRTGGGGGGEGEIG